jgi:hypothetical protein
VRRRHEGGGEQNSDDRGPGLVEINHEIASDPRGYAV